MNILGECQKLVSTGNEEIGIRIETSISKDNASIA